MFHLGKDEYKGLHLRYASVLSASPESSALVLSASPESLNLLRTKFENLMKALFKQKGAQLDINLLASDEAQSFINSHASILDSTFQKVEMSDTMRRRLQRSDYIFSGIKTFHELNEAFPSLLDENGNRKTFERFLNDVQTIDTTYNRNYLRAEYNFCQASAEMAAKWERFAEDGDRYFLQYRTAHDDKVRPEHAALDGITLPIDDSFWDAYYPPNGWNCRCSVVQVRKGKYPQTPHDEAMNLGKDTLQGEKLSVFHFNSGKQGKTMPDYNPYTIRRCNDCDVAKGNIKLSFVPDNELCQACKMLQKCVGDKEKTERAIERTHFLHEMEPLLKKYEILKTDGKDIKVGFSSYGNKHLFSDTFGRSAVLTKEDLVSLEQTLKTAIFVESAELTHPRNDKIDRFFYYEAQIRGNKVRLNVARKVEKNKNGYIRVTHFLYSINDI